MKITSDWHIHTRHSCDNQSRHEGLAIADLIQATGRLDIRDFGVSDHLNTPYNLPDIQRSYAEFRANDPSPHFHFGIEVSCVSQWELEEIKKGEYPNPVWGIRSHGPVNAAPAIGITAADLARYQIEYVIGGVHWPLYVPRELERVIRDYHRQHLFLAAHPLVDIVAHPWCWIGKWPDAGGHSSLAPWCEDFRKIPASMHDEFAASAAEHQTVVEISEDLLLNPRYPARFVQPYLEYLAGLKSRGVRLCVGSDCHKTNYTIATDALSAMLATVGLDAQDLWGLPPRRLPATG